MRRPGLLKLEMYNEQCGYQPKLTGGMVWVWWVEFEGIVMMAKVRL